VKQDFSQSELGGPAGWTIYPSEDGLPQRPPLCRPAPPPPLARNIAIGGLGGLVILALVGFWAGDAIDPDGPPVRVAPITRPVTASAVSARESDCSNGEGSGKVTPPRPIGNPGTWIVSDDYPFWSLVSGQQGLSQTVMSVDSAGRVASCSIAASSGSWWLDGTACRTLVARARFEPGRDSRGCPIPFQVPQRVRWVIPRG
jgi:hypothetical protein